MHEPDPWHCAVARGLPPQGVLLHCRIDHQRLEIWDRGCAAGIVPVSTSARGAGCAENSFQTPTGWHAIAERIGAGLPVGAVLRERTPTGEVLPEAAWRAGEADHILSRILWLDGLEPGHNRGPGCDTHARFIYLHGTNREDLLGRPASRGCIRLGNQDVVALFARVADRPAWCLIAESAA